MSDPETHFRLGLYSQHEVYTFVELELPRDVDRVHVEYLDHYPWVHAWGFRERGRPEHSPEQVEAELISVKPNWPALG